jgi:hypothetical protein
VLDRCGQAIGCQSLFRRGKPCGDDLCPVSLAVNQHSAGASPAGMILAFHLWLSILISPIHRLSALSRKLGDVIFWVARANGACSSVSFFIGLDKSSLVNFHSNGIAVL